MDLHTNISHYRPPYQLHFTILYKYYKMLNEQTFVAGVELSTIKSLILYGKNF